MLQHRWNWDRGWLHSRAQDEADRLRARQGKQWQRIASEHVRVLEIHERQAEHVQTPQGWFNIVKPEEPARVTGN